MGTILPLIRADIVLNVVPILSGSCTTALAVVTNAILSDKLVLAELKEAAERFNASPIPCVSIAKLFNLLLSLCN